METNETIRTICAIKTLGAMETIETAKRYVSYRLWKPQEIFNQGIQENSFSVGLSI